MGKKKKGEREIEEKKKGDEEREGNGAACKTVIKS